MLKYANQNVPGQGLHSLFKGTLIGGGGGIPRKGTCSFKNLRKCLRTGNTF